VTRVFSSKVRKGRVVRQKPAPGRHLLGRSRLRLTISKGKRAG
jgi:beta-lactam-binding protein with PASTA domain